jgi:hypothetical protein
METVLDLVSVVKKFPGRKSGKYFESQSSYKMQRKDFASWS